MLGDLSKKYESCGDPAIIADCEYDAGGKSYGTYQLSINAGSLEQFVDWLEERYPFIHQALTANDLGSREFDGVWKHLANECCPEQFESAQHEYIKSAYYERAVRSLREAGFDVHKHSETMKDVIWSRAVQYGVGNIVDMFTEATNNLGWPNVTWVDHISFDRALIKSIYDVCATPEWTSGSPALREGLYNRFRNECEEALEMLEKEGY